MLFHADKNSLATKSVTSESEGDKSDTLQDANEEVEPVAGPSNPMSIAENINEYELNDSDNETDVSMNDDSLPIVENINEYTFDSDWESENDINESLALSEKSISNPALTFMLEYSGLSQDQIMHIIKRNKNKNHETASKSVNAAANDICIELAETTKPVDKSMSTLPENCEKILESMDSQSIKDVCTAKDNIAIESIPSSPESDNLAEIEPLKDNAETLNVITSDISSSNKTIIHEECSSATKSDDVIQIDTSDSDSDDFIEIQDVPIYDMNISKNITKKKDIEITFKSDKKPEEDIFADIFEKIYEKEALINPEQIQSTDTINSEQQVQLISENSNNLKDNILDTIFEEPIKEEANAELPENIQLSENMPNDEDKILDTQNSDKSIEKDMPAQVSPLRECTQEKPVVLPTNKEDLTELKVNSLVL